MDLSVRQTLTISLPAIAALAIILVAISFFKRTSISNEPIVVNKPQLESMQQALQVLDDLSWEVAVINPAKGIIQARTGSGFFGEVSELVIEIERQQLNTTKIDVHSHSDKINDEISFFLARLQKRLDH